VPNPAARFARSLASGLKAFALLVVEAAKEWVRDRCHGMGAGLAFYAAVSIGPFVVLIVALASVFFGAEVARGQLVVLLTEWLGERRAALVRYLIYHYVRRPSLSLNVLSALVLVVGAAGFFQQLRDSINTVWDVRREEFGLFALLRRRAIEFSLTVASALLVLFSLASGAIFSALAERPAHERVLPVGPLFWEGVETAAFFVLVLGVTMLLFRLLPEVRGITWRDVFPGAAFTALVYILGRIAAAHYLASQSIASDAASALFILLLWFYYTGGIFLFGAEFTRLYADRYGSRRKRQPGAGERGSGP
jgi:membrane protein